MKRSISLILCLAFVAAVFASQKYEILQKATDGDAEAQNEVGSWCYNGTNGKKVNYAEALQWWSKSAKQGNVKAVGNMGMCYRYGHGVERDSLKAMRLYLKSIRSGNDSLMVVSEAAARKGGLFDGVLAALAYKTGNGVKRSGEKAKEYFLLAAEGGSVDAQREWALINLNTGHEDVALPWFTKAADGGDLSSTYFTGMMLMKGLGGEANEEKGLAYVQKAADRDFPQACYDLSQRYDCGYGVETDSAKAIAYLQRAAVLGSRGAQWDYAVDYRDGIHRQRSFYMALAWMAKAVDQGNTAYFKKAYCDKANPDTADFSTYLKGVAYVHIKNYAKADSCFDRLTAAGIDEGLTMKAYTIMKRTGEQLDSAARRQCIDLLKAASVSDPSAKALLAYVYSLSNDISAEEADACMSLLAEAADAGFPQATNTLGLIYNNLGKKGYAKAAQCFERAYNEGFIEKDAADIYAGYLRKGIGGEKNTAKAEKVEQAAILADYKDKLLDLYASTWLEDEND